jgi:hypothetical protein
VSGRIHVSATLLKEVEPPIFVGYVLSGPPLLWSKVVLQKLVVSQLVMKFPTFYGNRIFITVFTRTQQLSLGHSLRIKKNVLGKFKYIIRV